MYYDIRIEPKKDMTCEEIQQIIKEAFEKYGGLSAEGIELLGKD